MKSARYYDPGTGRFLSEDKLGHLGNDLSYYRYVLSSPVRHLDPSGFMTIVDSGTGGWGSGGSGMGSAGYTAGLAIGASIGGAGAVACTMTVAPEVAAFCLSNPELCNTAAATALDVYDSTSNIHDGSTTGSPPSTPAGYFAGIIDKIWDYFE